MQPTEPTPSDQQSVADAAQVEPSSEPAQEASQDHWWRRLVPRVLKGSDEREARDETPTEPSPSTVSLTREEFDRRVQAETDRRENKRLEAANVDRRRKLRDEDPFAYAEEDRKTEQLGSANQQVTDFFGNISREHDKISLDPLVLQLPEAERKRILSMEGAGVGLDGRKLIVSESLKALERHWKAEGKREAEASLRRNPAFRKQILGESRRGMSEPEFLTGGAASSSDNSVSNILRDQLRARH